MKLIMKVYTVREDFSPVKRTPLNQVTLPRLVNGAGWPPHFSAVDQWTTVRCNERHASGLGRN